MTNSTIATPSINANNLNEEQLISFRDCVVNEAGKDFAYFMDTLEGAVMTHAISLLVQQGVDTDANDEAVENLTDALRDLINVQVTFKGLDSDKS